MAGTVVAGKPVPARSDPMTTTTEGFIAWQCPMGKYHINAEHMMVDIVDEADRKVHPGEMGRVVVTTLENHLMPLVRYEVGDYAIASTKACVCGRTLPTIDRVIGRGGDRAGRGQGIRLEKHHADTQNKARRNASAHASLLQMDVACGKTNDGLFPRRGRQCYVAAAR